MKANPVEIPAVVARGIRGATKDGYLVLTRGGKPIAYVLPTDLYDEEDIGYMTDPEFWKMIEARRQQTETIPLEAIEAELAELERAESPKSRDRKPGPGKRKAS
jgi:hypothetical protein